MSSAVNVYNQDSDAPSAVLEEPSAVAEPSRLRPSTVTVIHTGTKWRQVPREVSWETTELWDRGGGWTTIPGLNVVAQFCSSRNLPSVSANHGRNLRSVGSARHPLLPPFPLSYRPGSTEGKMLTRSCYCGSRTQPGSRLSGRWTGKCHTKGNSLLTLLSVLNWVSWEKDAPLDALCKYPAWKCWVVSCYASEI